MMVNMASDPRRGAPANAFDPYAPSSEARYAEMERVRAAGGVAETAAGWYVATAAGVRAGLFGVERFVGSFVDTARMHPDDVVLSAIPEPRHGRIRRIVNGAIAGHRTAQAEPFVREQARRLVDRAVGIGRSEGRVDLVREAVDPLPSVVIAHMLGVPVADQERFRIWSDELLAAQGASNSAEIEGCPLRAGARVVFGIASANRDEGAFDRPAEFRLDRPHPRDHLAFGTGPHICPGAALARLESLAFLEAFCARVAAFRLAEGSTPEPNPVFWAHGWRSLVVALEASPT
jgi:cytochrome P450